MVDRQTQSDSQTHPTSAVRRRRGGRPPGTRPEPGTNWRWVSGGLTVVILAAGVFIFTNPLFFVTRAEVGGVRTISAEEVFTAAGVAGQHVLWVDSDAVESRVRAMPGVSAAEVAVEWPARVIIVVREREPALIWEQAGQRFWLDVNGILMPVRGEVPGLVRVVNEGEAVPYGCPQTGCAEGDSVSLDPAVVLGAQQIKTLRPQVDVLYYDPVRGLSFQDERGWRAYFGIGTGMAARLTIYETMIASLQSRGIQPVFVDVSNPSAPYFASGR